MEATNLTKNLDLFKMKTLGDFKPLINKKCYFTQRSELGF